MLSLQILLHGNHCYMLGISSNWRQNVLASLSPAQKNMLCICLHIGHHTARKSLFETQVSRNWHELLRARKAPLKPRQNKLLVKASNCSEANWNVAYTVLPQWRVGDPTKPFCIGSMEEAHETSGDQGGCSWNIQIASVHNMSSLLAGTRPKLSRNSWKNCPSCYQKSITYHEKTSSCLTRLEGKKYGACF